MIPKLNPNVWRQTQINDPVEGYKPKPNPYIQDGYIKLDTPKKFLNNQLIPSKVPNVFSADTISNQYVTDVEQNPVSVMAISKMKMRGDVDNVEDLLDRKVSSDELQEIVRERFYDEDSLKYNLFTFTKGLEDNELRKLLRTLLDKRIRYNVQDRAGKYQVYTSDVETRIQKEPMIETESSLIEETEGKFPLSQEMKESKFNIRTKTQLTNMNKDDLLELGGRIGLEVRESMSKKELIEVISTELDIRKLTPSKKRKTIEGEGVKKKHKK
jgi:hypothetical protein